MDIRVLLVDDNRDILRIYKRSLSRKVRIAEQNSLKVEPVDTVSEAIAKIEAGNIQILVVDLKIPGLNGEEWGGLEVIEESIKHDQLRPIIVITGFGSVELARKTLTQGAFDFIEKSTTAVNDLVEAVQRAINHLNSKLSRAGNPFNPRTGIEPTIFGGRTSELEFLEQKLHRAIHMNNCEHFVILGEWGIGKSTLLKEYKKICQSRGYLASIVTLEALQQGTRLIESARSIVEGVFRDLPYPIKHFQKAANYFQSVGISILGTGLQLGRNTLQQELSPQSFLHDSLLELWRDIQNKSELLVILIDDLENFMSTPEIILTLKATLSMEKLRNSKILVGLATTTKNWIDLTSVERHHPLARYFLSRIELQKLAKEELSVTVRNSLKETSISFSPEVIDLIYEYTDGHPFEMQLLCYHLYNNQLYGRVNTDIWGKALQDSLSDLGLAIFKQRLNQANFEETEIMSIIATSNNPTSVPDIRTAMMTQFPSLSTSDIDNFLQSLEAKRLISKKRRGFYTIPDPMFRTYISTQLDN